MASLPVVITQDDFIDLTMENTDDENTEKSLDGKATTTTKKGKGKLDSQESSTKKTHPKDLHDFLTNPEKFPKKKVVSPPKKKKRSTKTPKKDPPKKPKNNMTLTQDFLNPAK